MKKNVYVGLFLVTLATICFEIILTRIFSVTMWYHFAFVAISVAMFGITVGAIAVYLFPDRFTEEKAGRQMALSALCFSWAVIFSFLTQMSIPFVPEASIVGVYSMALTYVVIAVPFVFSGICVCLALTKFPRHVSRLYAADLAGGAAGCVILIYLLKGTDASTAVVVIAAFASLGAFFFSQGEELARLKKAALLTTALFLAFSIYNTFLASQQASLLRISWIKGSYVNKPLYEKWNSFSRVAVWGDPFPVDPIFWGMSPAYEQGERFRQYQIDIDAVASTVMTGFDGDIGKVGFLKYDITNFAHYVRPDSKVLVVGAGGGRDILSALAFGQRSVLGVEINENILEMLNRVFGDFSGHLDRRPNVRFVNDEARSYVARTKDRFDIIQLSLIDTWAATGAGAFVLTENSLYTVEAWKIFLDHLTPRGILTFSRWYYRGVPYEMYRLTSLASASLLKAGISDPRRHIVILRQMRGREGRDVLGVGTMLVSRQPFSDEDIALVEQKARELQFEVVLTPRYAVDQTFAALGSGRALKAVSAQSLANISAPVDDSPFFFHMLRFRNLFDWQRLGGLGESNARAIAVLVMLLGIVTVLSVACIIVPLALTTKKEWLKGSLPLFVFFMSIGLGFMLVEISQMQRLIIFLGHPIYGLVVVLCSLLLSSGLGSYATRKIGDMELARASLVRLAVLLGLLGIFGAVTTPVLAAFQGAATGWRIVLSAAMLSVLGFFMGMAFPLGMRLASARALNITPWLWGINGATSVCASVLAVVVSISLGISTTFWAGFACYAAAFLVMAWMAGDKGA